METIFSLANLVLIPLIGFLISLLIPRHNERMLAKVAITTANIQLFAAVAYCLWWLFQGAEAIHTKQFVLYQTKGYEFLIDFYFDDVSSAFLLVGAILTNLIVRYSRYYMHLEQGYKRFFNTILLFYVAYTVTLLSGNFETLFIGWEMLGISSFLLIAFYWERYLPVRNAVKVFSIYRIGDVGILLAMWASHHLWHENITFAKLLNYQLVHEHFIVHSGIGTFVALCIVVAAAAKSAQLPFSTWLPRAMEGPTPSSAIFYGALSVHFGLFLLLRTEPFWEHQPLVRIGIGVLGLATAITAYSLTAVQSTIKTQIGYASVAQIGLMFLELALGFHALVLIHFTGNAFLRSYQLLTSPSIVSYLIRDQLYHEQTDKAPWTRFLPPRLQSTIYVLALKEWYLGEFINIVAFRPFKKIGKMLNFLTPRNVLFVMLPLYITSVLLYVLETRIPSVLSDFLPEIFVSIGLISVFKAFADRKYPRLGWFLVIGNHFWVALAVSFNEHFDSDHTIMYLSGVIIAGIIGYIALEYLRSHERQFFGLNQYYGHVHEYRKLSLIFLLSALGMMGFPISFTFIGEDLIFSHIHADQFYLVFCAATGYIVSGIAVIRMYARLFLGPHCKQYHAVALPAA